MKYVPSFDNGFKPIYREYKEFIKKADTPFFIAVERENGYTYVHEMKIIKSDAEASYRMAERIVKAALWTVGGFKVIVGDEKIAAMLKEDYSPAGSHAFDADFMSSIYERPFEVEYSKAMPRGKENNLCAGGNFSGCRIGFDAGGSDRKVSAVIDGKCVYSEEVVWFPKMNSDPQYHYNGIKEAMLTAASKMPRVDAIGVSSAGIYVNNKIMAASLFIKVPKKDFNAKVKNMYIDIAREIGAPLTVANDGDVSAMAGAMEIKSTAVLGTAFGTSQAAGYIASGGGLNGWLSELAFVPVDMNPRAMRDEWSGDIGCGVKYFSQDSVIKLSSRAGITFPEDMSPAEKLKLVQKLNDDGDNKAAKIFEDIGIYLGHSIPFYAMFYDIKHLIIYGRVSSGKGGDAIMEYAKRVINEEYPEFKYINIMVPDEKSRRVGQAVAAASL